MTDQYTHGGCVYGGNAGCLDFSANINPLGLSPRVKRALHAHLGDVVHYPDPAARELTAAIAARYEVPPESIVLGNGAAELFYLYAQVTRPKGVCLSAPSFSEYERAARSVDAGVVRVAASPDDGFAVNVDELCARTGKCDLVIIGNPNNPTGAMLGPEEIGRLAANFKAVMVDESFLDFRGDAERHTARPLLGRCGNLIIVQSLTKFYAIPGLRLGFALTYNAALRERLLAAHDPWTVNLLAQIAGVAALGDGEYQRRSRELVAEEGRFLADGLARLPGVRVFPPTVNFILLRLAGMGAAAFARLMRGRGILVRDCGNYPGLEDAGHCVRVAVRGRDENLRLLAAAASLLGA